MAYLQFRAVPSSPPSVAALTQVNATWADIGDRTALLGETDEQSS